MNGTINLINTDPVLNRFNVPFILHDQDNLFNIVISDKPTVCFFVTNHFLSSDGLPWSSGSVLESESRVGAWSDRYCSGTSFIKISPSLAQAVPGPIQHS